MTTNFHKCPAVGCNKAVPNALFACSQDWARLPASYRDAINSAYRNRVTTAEPSAPVVHLRAMLAARRWYEEHPK